MYTSFTCTTGSLVAGMLTVVFKVYQQLQRDSRDCGKPRVLKSKANADVPQFASWEQKGAKRHLNLKKKKNFVK